MDRAELEYRELEYREWVGRWIDQFMFLFHEQPDLVLAENARALELGSAGDLPEEVLELFRIDVENVRENPEEFVRLAQCSYAAAFRTIGDLLRGRTP